MSISPRVRATRAAALAITATLVSLPLAIRTAQAHGQPAPLEFWGNFGTSTTHCQRAIGKAASSCVREVLDIRKGCAFATLAGQPCDANDLAARIDAVKRRAHEAVGQCTSVELQNLRYLSPDDAVADITNICGELDTAAVSAVFGPAMTTGSLAAVDQTARRCLETTARAAIKLLRYAIGARRRSMDAIAAKNLGPSRKLAMVQETAQKIVRARTLLVPQVETLCPAETFASVYGQPLDGFLERVGLQADCLTQRVYVQNKVTCPAPVCGNGMQEVGEECDDGNDFDGDACRSDCTKNACDVFPTTYDLIQRAIFENRGCTESACHGEAQSGGLDLRAGVSYQNLVDVAATTVPGYKRIDPGNKSNSLLWINLAARTQPDQWTAPLRGMPIGLDPLTPDELEALLLWIEDGGAARTASLPRTAELLKACVAEPRPAKVEPLAPPAPDAGVQMYMPNWTLPPKSESEVCFSSYYDFTGQIPAEFLTPDGTHFRYKELFIRQDPLSHHLIMDVYRGSEAPDDPVWGPYSCKGGPMDGTICDPLNLGFCGAGGVCATDPDPSAIACIGFGPQTGLTTLVTGGLAFAQSATAQFKFPPGVYNEMPIKGVVLWNSHAFNLTRYTGTLQAWVNIYFPKKEEQVYQEHQIFNASKIFWTDNFPPFPLPQLQPFEQMETCNHHVFGPDAGFSGSPVDADQTVHLFELSGHTHKRGKHFQIFRGRFSCRGGANDRKACSPFNAAMCPGGTCIDDGGRDPQAALLYTNLIYNDPFVLRLDPPILISGSAPLADRTLTYCALYDNGTPPHIDEVKRFSTSPPPGTLFGIPIGGPCPLAKTRCIGGPHHNEVCAGNDAACDSSPGASDGDCDACALTGGFRTEDEMFILFGNYWVE
jgi:cysteine-rich repeat protein